MNLLKRGTFEFNKILKSGYDINEQPNLISTKQMVNGNRKKIVTTYTDCIITINLGGIDNTDILDYISNLVDDEYEYYSFKTKTYKTANFIVTLPSLSVDSAYSEDEFYLNDLTVTLEKSSDAVSGI
jgi:hypothetical protein